MRKTEYVYLTSLFMCPFWYSRRAKCPFGKKLPCTFQVLYTILAYK